MTAQTKPPQHKSRRAYGFHARLEEGWSKEQIIKHFSQTETIYRKIILDLVRLGMLNPADLKPDQRPDNFETLVQEAARK